MSHERSDQTPIDSPVVDTTILTSEGVLKEVSKRSFLIDTVTGTGPYQAIVLDAWKEPVHPGAGTTKYASTLVLTVNRVRARILKEYSDAHIRQFPAPKHLPTGPDVLMTEVDKYKINMHPIYTCRDGTADQPLPRIGSRIWVGYARIGSGGPDGLGQLPEYWLAAESVVGGEEGGAGGPGSAQQAHLFSLSAKKLSGTSQLRTTASDAKKRQRLDINRVMTLAQKLQLPPEIVGAQQMKESAGDPSALAWNAHVMRKRIRHYYKKDKAKVKRLLDQMSAVGLGPPVKSLYKNTARKAFDLAYNIDRRTAVAGGAWGNYQILGGFAWEGNSRKGISDIKKLLKVSDDAAAEEFVRRFNSDPKTFSDDLLVAWVKANGGIGRGKWWKAARNPDEIYIYKQGRYTGYQLMSVIYFGGLSKKYADGLRYWRNLFLSKRTFDPGNRV
jgi:hypothetical protein